ncbi:MAG: tyrosine-type recombinase/integrase [Methylomonas sp.]
MAKELLSDTTIRNTKPSIKDVRLCDGNGLYLLVKPNNSRWWRLDYTINTKRKTLSLGTYPTTTLADARKKATELKRQVAQGIDPSDTRKVTKETLFKALQMQERERNGLCPIDSFKFVADEWYQKKMQQMVESYKVRLYSRLERDVFPYIGSKQISEISAQELLQVIQKIEKRGAIESAHRTLRTCGEIFRYGIATGRIENDVTNPLKGALSTPKTNNFAAITDKSKLKELLIAIESFSGSKRLCCIN